MNCIPVCFNLLTHYTYLLEVHFKYSLFYYCLLQTGDWLDSLTSFNQFCMNFPYISVREHSCDVTLDENCSHGYVGYSAKHGKFLFKKNQK